MAPQHHHEDVAPQHHHEDELLAHVDSARVAYEKARSEGNGAAVSAALEAWKVALDAFVAAVLPKEE